MTPEEEHDSRLQELIRDEQWDDVVERLKPMHPADIADVIDRAPTDAHARLFALLDDDVKPTVLTELESTAGTEVAQALSNEELSRLVSEMAPDDGADVLGELPSERADEVLKRMARESSRDVERLLAYDEDTAGGIMTTDVVAMREDQTVAEALNAIAYFDIDEKFYYVNVVAANNRLIGYVDIWRLLREQHKDRPLKEVLHFNYSAATVDMDQEEVVQIAKQYDIDVVPVVDRNGILVGRITADDILDVMEEEASEDIFRLAGSDDAELESMSVFRSCTVRLPWLFITLLGGFITSIILGRFMSRISGVMALAAFVPVVLAMGGNTGIQSSTLIVRSIALGGLKGRRISQVLFKEILTGALMGLVCGTVIALWAHFMVLHGSGVPEGVSPVSLAGVVAVALFSSMTFAALFGTIVPITLQKVHVDPAVASGPFITIANDIFALLIYFGVTLLLLQQLA